MTSRRAVTSCHVVNLTTHRGIFNCAVAWHDLPSRRMTSNILASNGISLFYAVMWPIGVMLIFVYIHMLPKAGDLDLPPRFDPADNRYRFGAWIQDVRDWVSQTRRPVHYQALDLVSVLDGPARGVAGQLRVDELIRGGHINGLQFDPVSYLLMSLAQHYSEPSDQTETDLVDILELFEINVRFLGEEYREKDFTGKDVCRKRGNELHFNKRDHRFSTTDLRKRVENAPRNGN